MPKRIIVVENKEELMDALKQDEQAILLILEKDWDTIELSITEALEFTKKKFQRVCYNGKDLYTGEECKENEIVNAILGVLDYIPSEVIVSLMSMSKFNGEDLLKTIDSTTKKEDKWKIIKKALSTDAETTLNELYMKTKSIFEEVLSKLSAVVNQNG